MILRDNGKIIEELDEVKANVMRHFKECFVEQNCSRPNLGGLFFNQLSGTESTFLVKPFTEDEIKVGVWRCDADKSPSPDGYNLRFIKLICWDLLKKRCG